MNKAQKKAHRHKQKMAQAVARALGVSRANKELFPAAAHALGKSWWAVGTNKAQGYALVLEYAERHGVKQTVKRKAVVAKLPVPVRDEFLFSYEWRKLRMVVLKKRGARCECCGASPRDGQTVLNVDHIKPRKLFPELALDESNLQVLCSACNHGKGNWDQTDWRQAV